MKKRMNFPRQVWIWLVLIVVNGSKFCIVLVFFKGGRFSFRPSLEHGRKLLLFFFFAVRTVLHRLAELAGERERALVKLYYMPSH